MMHPRDPAVGQFEALLNDLVDLQRSRDVTAPVHRAIERHGIVPGQFGKALRQTVAQQAATRAATAAELTRTISGIERLAVENRKLAQAQMGERRARLRQQATDLLRRAMIGLGKGEITAIEISKLEARVNRFLTEIDQQPASAPVRARVAA